MKTDEKFMKLAIQEAKKSVETGGAPIGAVLVKDGEVVATGQSLVWPKKDPSAHGETECLRNACKKLNTLDLSGCILYSTLESCSMCLGCASWTGLSKIVFGVYKEDIGDNPYEIKDYHAEEHAERLTPIGGGRIEIQGGVLREECAELMKNIENWSPTK
jgi:tRNA(Arg) A34 adenosine deaminase TadA